MNAYTRPIILTAALLLFLTHASAHAACSSPEGVEGELVYNGAYKTVQFCDGSSWISMSGTMANESDPEISTLSANKWCAANAGGTAIECNQNTPTTSAAGAVTGAVQFRGSSGAFASDDTNLVWDDAGNRLGIGTATPVASIDLAGGIKLGTEACSAAKSGMLVWTASTLQLCTATGSVSLANAAGLIGAAPVGATYVTQTPDSTLSGEQALSLLASGIVKVTTGTGVLSSVASIDLGGADASGTLAAGRFPALTGDVTTTSGSLATSIANDAVTYAKLQNVTSGRLLGRSSAGAGDAEEISLGAGLALSGTTLSVSGASSALSSITAATATNTIDSLNYGQTWNWSTATTQSPLTLTADALTTGSLLSLTSSSASINSTNGLLYVANTGAGTTGTVARIAANSTAGSGLTVLTNGRIGIGATSPSATLDIVAPNATNPTLRLQSSGSGRTFAFTASGGLTLSQDGGTIFSVGPAVQPNYNVNYNTNISLTGNGGGGVERRLVLQTGNNPSAYTRIELGNGVGQNGGNVNQNLGEIGWFANSGTDLARISGSLGGANNSGKLSFFTKTAAGSLTEIMRIDAAGNVGIGITSPDSLLAVANTGYAQFLRDSAGAPVAADCDAAAEFGRIVIDSTNDRWYVCEGAAGWKYTAIGTAGGSGSAPLSAITAATDANTIANATNAQVWNWALTGATSDAFTFGETAAATGGTAGDQSILKAVTLASSTATPLIITNLGNGPSFRVNDETGDTDTTPFVIDAAGNVGIGTAAPERALHVVGTGGVSDDLFIESSTDTASGGGAFIFARSRGTSAAKTTPLANDLLGVISGRAWTGTGYENTADINFRSETDYATTRSGYLSFSTRAAGTVAERMRIASNGNVGIGTTAPTSKLHITGSGTEDGLRVVLDDSNNILLGYATSGTNVTHNLYTSGSTGILAIHAAGTEQIRLSSNGSSFLNGGNVGIGTIAPTQLLEVRKDQAGASTIAKVTNVSTTAGTQARYDLATGSANAYSILSLTESATPYFEISSGDGVTGGMYFTSGAASTNIPIVFRQSSTERMRIAADGHVGIGTTSPTSKLHVESASFAADTSARFVSTASHNHLAIDAAPGFDAILALQEGGINRWRLSNKGSDDRLFVRNAASAEVLTVLQTGNVGIGTTAPSSLLAVANTGYAQFLRDSAGVPVTTDCDAAAEFGRIVIDSTNDRWYVCEGAAGWKYTAIGTAGGLGAAPLSAITAASGANTIANATNAQVWNWALSGATADAFTFGETTAATGGTAGDQSVLKATTLAASTATPLLVTNLGNGPSFRVNDETGDTDATPFIINASGNIGIGTTSPGAKLHVDGDMLLAATLPRIASASYLTLQSGAGQAMTFNTGGASERMRITSTGTVGIGTASPSATLHVVGSAYIDGGRSNLNSQSNSGASARNFGPMLWTDNLFGAELGHNGALWTNRIFTRDSDGAIEFGKYPTDSTTNVNSFSPWMTIVNNGNVGIATTGPGYRLDLNGAQAFRGMAAPGVSPAGQGVIYFDSTSNTFKVSQNGGAFADLLGGGGGGSPAGSSTELQYRNGSAFGATTGMTWDATNRALTLATAANPAASALTLTGGALTGTTSYPVLNMTQTWNNSATTFTALQLSVTNTASNASSKLLDLSAGGASRFSVLSSGATTAGGTISSQNVSGNNFSTATLGSNYGYAATGSNMTSGRAFTVWGSGTGVSSGFTGDMINVSPTRSVTTAATVTDTGNYLDIARSNSTTIAGATFNHTGDLVTLTSTMTPTAGTITDSSRILYAAQNYASASGNVVEIVNNGTGASFRVNDDGTTTDSTPFFIDASGNVGIGTASPGYPLQIASGSAQYPTALGIMPSTHATSRRAALTIDDWLVLQDGSGNGTKDFGIWQSTPGAMRLYIGTTGNVGIGTTNPVAKLHVANGAIRLDNSQSLTWTGTGGWNGSTTGTQIFKYSDNNLYFDTYDGSHVFRRASSAESMRISSTGNVGIGTTAPAHRLHVVGNARVDGVVYVNNTNFSIAHDGSNASINNYAGAQLWYNQVGTADAGLAYRYHATTGNAAVFDIYRNGNAWIAGTLTQASDRRLKHSISTLDDAYGLAAISRLRPVSFKWNNRDDSASKEIGLIAQEVEAVVPDVITTGADAMKTKSIAYSQLTPILIKAVQELQRYLDALRDRLTARLDNHDAEIAALKAENRSLLARLERLEAANDNQEKAIQALSSPNSTLHNLRGNDRAPIAAIERIDHVQHSGDRARVNAIDNPAEATK
ncbi:MAG: hypothetical protein EBS23_01860 [Betaproteobacteria bacterium]|nr:hypothetical protein [Betaproteobacteria bacterium]